MEIEKLKDELESLKRELETLPSGYISKKMIQGKIRYYLQWSESGKKKSKYIGESNVDTIFKQIEHRKEVLKRIKEIESVLPKEQNNEELENIYQNTPLLKFCGFIDGIQDLVSPF